MIRFGIVWYIMGLTVFYVEANFEMSWWKEVYYLWDKSLLIFLFIGIHSLLPRQNKPVILPVIYFAIIRFIWQIVTSITGWEINDARAVAILFIVLSVVCAYLTIKGTIKWEKR